MFIFYLKSFYSEIFKSSLEKQEKQEKQERYIKTKDLEKNKRLRKKQ